MDVRVLSATIGKLRLAVAGGALGVAIGAVGLIAAFNLDRGGEAAPVVLAGRFSMGYPAVDLVNPTPSPTPTPEPTATPTPEPVRYTYSGNSTYSGGSSGGSYSYNPGITSPTRTMAGWTMVIPKISVNNAISTKVVPTSGVMPDPSGPWDIVWYDFANHPGTGGFPGEGGNAVFAGHVDYIRIGKVVFGYIENLVPGDVITLYGPGVTLNYYVDAVFHIDPYADATYLLRSDGTDRVTLITCGGVWLGSHYSDRVVVQAHKG